MQMWHLKNWFESKKILSLIDLVLVERPGFQSNISNIIKLDKSYSHEMNYKSIKVNYNLKSKRKTYQILWKKHQGVLMGLHQLGECT